MTARHLQTAHIKEEEQYNCQNCIYTTNRKDHFKVHKCVKSEYDCDVCDMTFETSDNLKNHKRKHKDKSLQCSRCQKAFNWKDSLKKHEIKCHL